MMNGRSHTWPKYNYERERLLHPLLKKVQETLKAYILMTGDTALAWEMADDVMPALWNSWWGDRDKEVWDCRPDTLFDLYGLQKWAAGVVAAPELAENHCTMVAAIEAAVDGFEARHQQEKKLGWDNSAGSRSGITFLS
jgi:hypothetical protein